MKFFKKIFNLDTYYDLDYFHPALLYYRKPKNRSEFIECLNEISKYSECTNCGRCCKRAPELTYSERLSIENEFPNVKLIKGKQCPFRKNDKCILHSKQSGFCKPLQCRSYICQPHIRNNYSWMKDFCTHFNFEFDHVST